MWIAASLWFILKCLIGKTDKRPEYLFTIVAFVGYFVEFMLEVTMYSVTNHLVFLAYIGLIPVACKMIEQGENE